MTRQSVQLQSSSLSRAEYDADTEQLEITFVNGRSYTFERVPERVFEELRDSPSPGSYFNREIKGAY
jgi:KTSC domain